MAKYLKSIELFGFKSFPNKTVIEFVDGITGIVGANGSGKSNIVESIKWVLGEQSAKNLRGDKMEDVIFNGTKNRSPMGLAEVTLTFDNSIQWLPLEFSEVSITRRNFRSGEGQYFINKSKVRLKDIVEVFLDTGIGRDSYAIFEQGKIDRLLSESPVERRLLFEEFAGISKFKYRKEEAEKKLESARINLERLNEIINGLSVDLEKLKKQAEVAMKYNELKKALLHLEIRFEALRVYELNKEIDNKERQRNKIIEKLEPLNNDLNKKSEDLINLEKEIQNLEVTVNDFKEKLNFLEKNFNLLEAKINNNREKKETLEKQLLNMDNRLKEYLEKIENLKKEYDIKQNDLEEIIIKKDELNDKNQNITIEIEEIQRKLKDLDREILSKSQKLGFNKIINSDDIHRISNEVISLGSKLENMKNMSIEKNDYLKFIEKDINDKNAYFSEVNQDIHTLKSELVKVVELIEKTHNEEENLKNTIKSNNKRIDELNQELRKMDNVIMESIEKQAEKIKVFYKDKPYLVEKFSNIINQIKEKIMNNEHKENILKLLEELKIAYKDIETKYQEILDILYSEKGTYTKKENIIKEIDKLNNENKELNNRIEELRVKIKEYQVVKENLQSNYSKNEYELNSIEQQIKKLISEKNQMDELLKGYELQIAQLNQEIEKKNRIIEEMANIIDEYEDNLQEYKLKRSKLIETQNNLRIDIARIEEKNNSLLNEINRIKKQINEINHNIDSYSKDKSNIESVIAELNKLIEKDNLDLENLKLTITELEKNYKEKKDHYDLIVKDKKVLENQKKELEQEIVKYEKNLVSIEAHISERKAFLNSVIENANKTYNIDITKYSPEEGDDFEKLNKSINEIRNELSSLGDVNFLAIEQYQETKEKLEFLNNQKMDSEKAINDIISLIDETNQKSKEQFLKAFEDIRKAFKKIFARLFDGGRADLILQDEKDVLNCGINIMAEPPGKKFQNISLLSGGERALVAISVIFAILYLKPTPFVVLDEMDAPLDDDNIERFKMLLKDFKETTQFILVSHSKSTLEICDALYGVTMEEQGVSKVVNVAFENADLILKNE